MLLAKLCSVLVNAEIPPPPTTIQNIETEADLNLCECGREVVCGGGGERPECFPAN